MKLFSITLTANHDLQVDTGVTLCAFPSVKKPAYGINLGFFTPRRTDTEGATLRPKYLKVYDVEESKKIDHLKLHQVPEKSYMVGNLYKEGEEDTDENVLVYLDIFDAASKARFLNSIELRNDNRLIEGKYFQDNVVKNYVEGAKKDPFSCPSLLTCKPGETFQVSYRDNATNIYYTSTFKYDDGEIKIVSTEEKARREFNHNDRNRRGDRIQRTGSFGDKIAEALSMDPDFNFKKHNKRPGYRNDRARKRALDRKYHNNEDY